MNMVVVYKYLIHAIDMTLKSHFCLSEENEMGYEKDLVVFGITRKIHKMTKNVCIFLCPHNIFLE